MSVEDHRTGDHARPRREWLIGVGLFGLSAALFALIQWRIPGLADNDSYYHAKMGWLIHSNGIKQDFVWLPQTILNRADYYDHHMLYHGYLALFAWRDPALDGGAGVLLGAKIASVLLPAAAFVAVWRLLRGQRIRWAGVWTVGLFAMSDIFLFRLSMVRAQSASLLVLVLALHWLLQRRYRWLLPLGWGYVWLYNAFPLLFVVVGAYLAVTLICERRMVWSALGYSLVGVALGLVINPYFPQNISFIISHIGTKLIAATAEIGAEWFPYDSWTLMQTAGAAYAIGIVGLLALIMSKQGFDRLNLLTFGLYLIFGVLTLKSKRFLEYFPAFALLFGATSITPLLESWRATAPTMWRRVRLLLPALLGLLVLITVINTQRSMLALDTLFPANTKRAAALWLNQNAAPNTLIYNTEWRQFPRLFFYDTTHSYVLGLDPTYLQLADADQYAAYVAINAGEVAQPGQAIRERFGAHYVVASIGETAFIAQANADPTMREVFRSGDSIVWQIK